MMDFGMTISKTSINVKENNSDIEIIETPEAIQKRVEEQDKKRLVELLGSKQAEKYIEVEKKLKKVIAERLEELPMAEDVAVGYRLYLIYKNTGSRPSKLIQHDISNRLRKGSLDNPKTCVYRIVHESCSKDSFSLTVEYIYGAGLRNILDILINYTRSIEDAVLFSVMSNGLV